MDLGITGRTALVLGASGGLGSAIAVRLAEEGANVAAAGRSADKVADTVKRIEAADVKALPVTWDLGDLDSVDTHVSEIENVLGPVDILVNNTGGPPPTPAAGQDAATWRTSFEQMILSVIVITDRVLPGMRERGWGRILTSTSGGALSPIPNLAISNTLRASLHTWSKTLSDEVGRDGVTSNIIVPGRIETDRTRFLDERKAEREGQTSDDVMAASATDDGARSVRPTRRVRRRGGIPVQRAGLVCDRLRHPRRRRTAQERRLGRMRIRTLQSDGAACVGLPDGRLARVDRILDGGPSDLLSLSGGRSAGSTRRCRRSRRRR